MMVKSGKYLALWMNFDDGGEWWRMSKEVGMAIVDTGTLWKSDKQTKATTQTNMKNKETDVTKKPTKDMTQERCGGQNHWQLCKETVQHEHQGAGDERENSK